MYPRIIYHLTLYVFLLLVLSSTSNAAEVPGKASAEVLSVDAAVNENSPKQTTKLKGKDFELTASVNTNELYQDIYITINGGEPVTDYVDIGGHKSKLGDIIFASGDSFELKNLIPGAPREQLVVSGSEWIPRGVGALGTYSIYRIDEKSITLLLSLITDRYRSDDEYNKQSSLSFKATVQEKMENGKLVIVYRYQEDGGEYHTINFRWNGKAFVDATGTYKKIDEEYSP